MFLQAVINYYVVFVISKWKKKNAFIFWSEKLLQYGKNKGWVV